MDQNSIYHQRTSSFALKTRWLYFYIFIRFPLAFFLGAIDILNCLVYIRCFYKSITGLAWFSVFIAFSLYIYSIIVYRGMRVLDKPSYRNNMVLLVVETIVGAIYFGLQQTDFGFGFIISLVSIGLIWLLPNYIYFKKRRELFNDTMNIAASKDNYDGFTYVGEWKNSQRHGQGTVYYADGSTYTGEWQNGQINGRGSYVSPEGTTYVGEWQNNKWHGQGKLTNADGTIYEGIFENGKYVGRGSDIKQENGSSAL